MSPQGLLRRAGRYYARKRIPKDLIPHFHGKRELKEALRTSDHETAKKRLNLMLVKFDALLEQARTRHDPGVGDPSPEEALAIIRDYVRREDRRRAELYGRTNWAEEPEETREALNETRYLEHAYRLADHHETMEAASSAADDAFGSSMSRASYRDNYNLIRRAVLELERRELARHKQDHWNSHFDPLFANSETRLPGHAAAPRPVDLKTLVARYQTEYQKTKSKVGHKRREKVSAATDLILRFFGPDTQIQNIDPTRCAEFRDTLDELPSNLRQHFPNKVITLSTIVAEARKRGLPRMTWETQDHYLRVLKRLFIFAKARWFVSEDPTASLEALGERTAAKEARDPFTLDQLSKIFNAPLYRGCANDGAGYGRPGPNVIRGTRFWIPLIGLFSGMRLNEICQLDIADIRKSQNGTWFISINKDQSGKLLKNEHSKREVPIHPELIHAGFLDFVQRQRNAKSIKLFPGLKRSERGYHSERMSRWFNEGFLRSAKAKTDKTSFHSFRHCFRDALREIDAPAAVVQGLGGWEMEAGTSGDYGTGLRAEKLVSWLKRIKYEGLDLTHLHLAPNK